MRSLYDELESTWVVTPTGRVKTVYYAPNVQSPLLRCAGPVRGGRLSKITEVHLSDGARNSGYRFYEDLCREDPDGKVKWEAWLSYQNHPNEQTRGAYPAALLPLAVVELQNNAPRDGAWKPPTDAQALIDLASEDDA